MNFAQHLQTLSGHPRPVILLEGTRRVPDRLHPHLTRFAAQLADYLPHAIFRSGNADGTDHLFAQGVAQRAPTRLELVLPATGHRRKQRHPDAAIFALSQLTEAEQDELARHTLEASPAYRSMLQSRHQVPTLRIKANYLLRDTLKVVGCPAHGLAPADTGIFYTQPDPMEGGTGHTIRVCHSVGIPVFTQPDWWTWPPNPNPE